MLRLIFFLQAQSKIWKGQKDKLVHAFDRILKSKSKTKQKPPKNEVFFNSENYLMLAKVVPKTSSQSTDDTADHVPEPFNVEQLIESSQTSTKKAKIKGHADYCLCVCIGCLDRTKINSSRPLTQKLIDELAKLCADFSEIIDYLPKRICDCCRKKLENKSATLLVDYHSLTQNVKEAQMQPGTSTQSKCSCEICRIATTTINPTKSNFLLQSKPKQGRPSLEPVQSKDMDFNGLKKTEKVNKFMEFSPDTRDQMSIVHLDQRFAESDPSANHIKVKRLHGHPQVIPKPGTENQTTKVIGHGTLIKIKKELYLSQNKSVKLAQILSAETDGVGIEKYFKKHVIETGKALEDFFEYKTLDMENYEKIDLQLWRLEGGTLINKSGNVHFADYIMVLPEVARPGCIEDANSSKVLTLKKGEVTLNSKIALKKTVSTRSNAVNPRTTTIPKTSESQTWIAGYADSRGWFRIQHKSSGKYLTSTKTDVTVDDCLEKESSQSQLFTVKKDFAYCNDIEAFITHVAHERNYDTDQELKVEIGLDSGKGSCKLFMSIEENNPAPINLDLGAGEFAPPPKKQKKEGKYMSKYKDRGVKKLFVIGLVRKLSETYHNFEKILSLSGIQQFGFIFDFKATRICLGMQPCSAKYSCSYCLGTAPFEEEAELRTFESVEQDHQSFLALCVQVGPETAKKRAKECHSVTQKSLITGDFPKQFILFKVLIDELHVFLGIGNKIFDELHAALTHDIENGFLHPSIYVWANTKSIVGQNYNGGQMDGPNLNLLLTKLDELETVVDPRFHKFIECLRLFHEVKKACFGMNLAEDWEEKIELFKTSYKSLDISVTPKVHCLFYEVPIFIRKTGKALGHFSAQHFESGHFDFEQTLNNFKTKESNPKHGPQIVKSLVTYAGEHV